MDTLHMIVGHVQIQNDPLQWPALSVHTQEYLTDWHMLAYQELLVLYKYGTIPAVAYFYLYAHNSI